MNKFRIIFTTIVLFLAGATGYAQAEGDEDEDSDFRPKTIDSAMAISPLYLPTSFTKCGTTFFEPVEYQEIDTTMDLAGQSDPLLRTENIYQSLGINGQAHKPMNFTFSKDLGFSLITNPYPLYFKTQNDLKYYKLKTSYTQLAYSYGIATENIFYATHAQNIRNLVNYVVNLRGYGNSGYFNRQQTSNIIGDALVHFEIPSEIYGFRLSYIVNYFNMQENGGLFNVQEWLNQSVEDMKGYNMNLYDAASKVLTHDLMFQQYINIKAKKKKSETGETKHWGTFTHTFQFKMQDYCFGDSPVDSLFLPYTYALPTDSTRDTLSFYVIYNTLQYSTFQPYREPKNQRYFAHITGGITHEYAHYQRAFYSGNAFIPFAQVHFRLFKKLDLQAKIYYTLGRKHQDQNRGSFASGCYQSNDMNFSANACVKIGKNERYRIGADFDFYRISPDFIYSYFSDNHHYWHNKWPKQNIIRLTPFFQYKDYKVEFSYFMLNNYLYWNENLEPTLLDSYANIIQLHVFAPFRYKGFGVTFNGYLQYANKEAIQVPLFAGKLDFFYRMNIFKKKAKLQIGFNAAYNTDYYADAYYPLLHQFYHQHEVKTGNYFYLDLYLGIQVQRINIFLKGSHLLAGLMGYNYFTTPDYPMQKRLFSLGISWRFHD